MIDELAEMFGSLERCCLHQPQWHVEDVDAVLCGIWGSTFSGWKDAPKADTDCGSIWVARLKDGSYGLLCESEDYTGHGCRCSSYTERAASLAGVLERLDDGERMAVAFRMLRDADPAFEALEEMTLPPVAKVMRRIAA